VAAWGEARFAAITPVSADAAERIANVVGLEA